MASNLGFAAANNRGIRAATADRLLLLNPDAAVTPRAIDSLLEALDTDPRVAIAGPRIVDDAGRAELSFGPHIGPLDRGVAEAARTRSGSAGGR